MAILLYSLIIVYGRDHHGINDATETLLRVLDNQLIIYMFSGGISFCCFGYMISHQISLLARRVAEAHYNPKTNWNDFLDQCKYQYYHMTQLVMAVNKFHGLVVFVLIAHGFVSMINGSFQIVVILFSRNINKTSLTIYITFLVIRLCLFAFVAYVPHRLHVSVSQSGIF